MTETRHFHVYRGPADCPHGSHERSTRWDTMSLGRGSGASFGSISHEGPRESCPDPDTIEPPVLPCFRYCCESGDRTHIFMDSLDDTPCSVCGVIRPVLEAEREAAEKAQRDEDARHAESLRKFRAEILSELRYVFYRHHQDLPTDDLLAGLVEVVESHAGE